MARPGDAVHRERPHGRPASSTLGFREVPPVYEADSRKVFVPMGGLFATTERTICTTILGSCVSVCLWAPELGIGGINHFLLPDGTSVGRAALRIGGPATERLVAELEALGAPPSTLLAKVVGGAHLAQHGEDRFRLGERNARVAVETLERIGIVVVAKDIGGSHGRKLRFRTSDGEAGVKTL